MSVFSGTGNGRLSEGKTSAKKPWTKQETYLLARVAAGAALLTISSTTIAGVGTRDRRADVGRFAKFSKAFDEAIDTSLVLS